MAELKLSQFNIMCIIVLRAEKLICTAKAMQIILQWLLDLFVDLKDDYGLKA